MYNDTMRKMLRDALVQNEQSSKFKLMSIGEKGQYIKEKYNLSHGNGKRKTKKK